MFKKKEKPGDKKSADKNKKPDGKKKSKGNPFKKAMANG